VPDLDPPGPEGCRGKIDFLFVISNSGTMTSHQEQVHTALPDFIDAIESNFVDFDRHIMVVDTDHGWLMKDCSLCGPGCDPNGELPTCGAELDECDKMMGAGVTFPAGKDSSARRCDLAAGRYITREDPDPWRHHPAAMNPVSVLVAVSTASWRNLSPGEVQSAPSRRPMLV
jgi:hypothetical protein